MTAYSYPPDPINAFDLDGQKWNWKRDLKRGARWVRNNRETIVAGAGLAACMFASAGLCSGLAMVGFDMSAHGHIRKAAKKNTWQAWAGAAGNILLDGALAVVPGLRVTKFRSGGVKSLAGKAWSRVTTRYRPRHLHRPRISRARGTYSFGAAARARLRGVGSSYRRGYAHRGHTRRRVLLDSSRFRCGEGRDKWLSAWPSYQWSLQCLDWG